MYLATQEGERVPLCYWVEGPGRCSGFQPFDFTLSFPQEGSRGVNLLWFLELLGRGLCCFSGDCGPWGLHQLHSEMTDS